MAEIEDLRKKHAFAGWPMLVFWALILVFTFHASTHMVAAGDTWVALACGRHFANHGVDTVEPFSANSHKAGPTEESIKNWPAPAQSIAKHFDIETLKKWHPTGWINQNWLTHLTFYKLVTMFGKDGEYNYDALVYWKFGLYLLNAVAIYLLARTLGVSAAGASFSAAFALFVGRTFLDIRPAGYANLFAPVFLLVIALAVYKNIHYCWLLIPVTVLWANHHGGYIYIFIMLVPFVVIHTMMNLPNKKWIIASCSGLTWMAMYFLTIRFLHSTKYELYQRILPQNIPLFPGYFDGMFWMILFFTAVGCVVAYIKDTKPAILFIYSSVVSGILFIALMSRYIVDLPKYMNTQYVDEINKFFNSGILSLLGVFVVLGAGSIILVLYKESIVKTKPANIRKIVYAAILSFIAMVLFNPFRLTNLTHTFEISISKHAESWRTVNEWRPAFDFMDPRPTPNPVGDEESFAVLCVLTAIVTLVYITALLLKPRYRSMKHKGSSNNDNQFKWPSVDIAMITLTAFTVFMAVKSRRFIPIAASAACPVIALFIEQSIRMLTVRFRPASDGKYVPGQVPKSLKYSVISTAGILILVFGSFSGYKFKRIYLDPWSQDDRFNSIFMRMTASNLKPFDACKFIKDNKLSGNMYNYWTEGGAIAFGQEPDPETGKTPLQLFMDGRAQAAYNHDTFVKWKDIKAGGDELKKAILTKGQKRLTLEDYKKAGQWIEDEFDKSEVWIIVMPSSEMHYIGTSLQLINSTTKYYFSKAIESTGNWAKVYEDDNQHILVNIKHDKGRKLINDIVAGNIKFPNEFSENLTLAGIYLRSQGTAAKSLEHAKKAFELSPTNASAIMLRIIATSYPELLKPVMETMKVYFKDFTDNQREYEQKSGYSKRLVAALQAANLIKIDTRDPEMVQKAKDFIDENNEKPLELATGMKW